MHHLTWCNRVPLLRCKHSGLYHLCKVPGIPFFFTRTSSNRLSVLFIFPILPALFYHPQRGYLVSTPKKHSGIWQEVIQPQAQSVAPLEPQPGHTASESTKGSFPEPPAHVPIKDRLNQSSMLCGLCTQGSQHSRPDSGAGLDQDMWVHWAD